MRMHVSEHIKQCYRYRGTMVASSSPSPPPPSPPPKVAIIGAGPGKTRWKYMKITSIWQKMWKLADTSLLRYGQQLLYTPQSSISTIFPFIRRNVLLPCLGDVSPRTVGTRRLGWPFLTTSSYLLWTGSMCGRRVEKWTILWGGRGNCTWRKVNQHV
jgi:hypothetical protein